MNKICRICWNTRDWRQPTGEAAKLEKGGTYVQTQGYGLEEWLFNFAWRHPDGNKYGYLQPVGKYRSKYEGTTFDILVYARNQGGVPLAIAEMRNVSVLSLREAASAYQHMDRRGWIQKMQEDVDELPRRAKRLPTEPEQIVNVRFDPDGVRFFDPPRPFPRNHATYKNVRYQPLNWSGHQEFNSSPTFRRRGAKEKSESEVFRRAVAETSYNPRHNEMQNALKALLLKRHGAGSTELEVNGVDIVLRTRKMKTFFEVKTHITVKACIREALGQLLEYAIYPAARRADRLVIVGDTRPTAADVEYLAHLRTHLPLPIYYSAWDWDRKQLDAEC